MSKKKDIISAAVILLAANGVHNTPMSAIAKAADTGMGTIYNYFPNKESLINTIYVVVKTKEKDVFEPFNPSRSIKNQFRAYYFSIIDFFIRYPEYFQFMDQMQSSPMITEESRAVGMESMNSVLELLKQGREDRVIKKIELEELIQFIGGSILSYLRWKLSMHGSNRGSPDNQFKLVWDAIKI